MQVYVNTDNYEIYICIQAYIWVYYTILKMLI